MLNKKWYLSKTLWINVLSIVGILIQTKLGNPIIAPELEVTLLSVINIIIRTVTKSNITW